MASLQRLGSMLLMRKRAMPSTRSSASIRSRKVSPSLPKSPMFTPVSTISRTPEAAISRASATVSATVPLRLRPRARGMVQKLQK